MIGIHFIPGTTCNYEIYLDGIVIDGEKKIPLLQISNEGKSNIWVTEVHATNERCTDALFLAEKEAFKGILNKIDKRIKEKID